MSASDHLSGPQFSSVPTSFEEHRAAIEGLQKADPERFWTVSPVEGNPEQQSFKVQDQSGNTHGYYYLKPQNGGVYLGGLVNTSGARGVGSHVLDTLENKHAYLEGFNTPDVGQFYRRKGFSVTHAYEWDEGMKPPAHRPEYGTPGYLDMERTPRRERKKGIAG